MQLSSPIEIIKKSLGMFLDKDNLWRFVWIFIPLLPFSIFSLWQGYYIEGLAGVDPSIVGSKPFIYGVVTLNLLYVFVYSLASMASVLAVDNVNSGVKESTKTLYLRSWNKLGKFILLGLLMLLVGIVGGIFLIIPAVVFWVWFSFAQFEFLLKNVGVISSFGASKKLVSGRFWKVFARLLSFLLFSIITQIALTLIPYLGTIISPMFGALFVLPNYLLYKELEYGTS